MIRELLQRRDVRKGIVDVATKGIGFAVAGVALLVTDLDPVTAAGVGTVAAAAADIGRRRLRDWQKGAPS